MSTHEDFTPRDTGLGPSDRSFGTVFTIFFAVLAFWPAFHAKPIRWPLLLISATFLLITMVRASLLQPLNELWTRLARVLNKITTPVITGLLFFVVVTPVAIILRLKGKDPLRLRYDSHAESYWLKRNPPGPSSESMANQF